MSVLEQESGPALLKAGEELIAEGAKTDLSSISVPRIITFTQAEASGAHSPALHHHPFPTCFVCGPERTVGDGLRIFPGPVELSTGGATSSLFASAWIPAQEFAHPDGEEKGSVRDEFLWAALDCPSGFAAGFARLGKLVTGRLAAEMVSPVRAGERCILLSWPLGIEGRKHHAAAVLLGEDCSLRARARATWIKLD